MAYQPKNLPKDSTNVVVSLQKGTMVSIETSIQEATYLLEALKNYKQAITRHIDLGLEKADLISKYSRADTEGIYNLPGVMANTVANYDMADMKKDNERLGNVKGESEQAEHQSELYYKMIINNANDLNKALKTIANNNINLKTYFENLANFSDWKN